jgi:hypothetical protein
MVTIDAWGVGNALERIITKYYDYLSCSPLASAKLPLQLL